MARAAEEVPSGETFDANASSTFGVLLREFGGTPALRGGQNPHQTQGKLASFPAGVKHVLLW
jgi:hypothetical protein